MTNKQAIEVLNMVEAFGLADEAKKLAIKALQNEKPHSEWIDDGQYAEGHSEHAYHCKKCGYQIIELPSTICENRFCKYCGSEMKGGKE